MNRPDRFAIVVLAAGRSRRFGRGNKLLASVRGRPLIQRAVVAACHSRALPVIVVTGHQAPGLRQAILPWRRRLRLVHNRHYRSGMAGSLRCGLRAVPTWCSGVIVALGDMPDIRAGDVNRLIRHWRPGDSAVVPYTDGVRSNPVLLHRELFEALQTLEGYRGARKILARPEVADRVRRIAGQGQHRRDIDTRGDWRRLGR